MRTSSKGLKAFALAVGATLCAALLADVIRDQWRKFNGSAQ